MKRGMKRGFLLLSIALFAGCDIIEPVGVDIKDTSPVWQ